MAGSPTTFLCGLRLKWDFGACSCTTPRNSSVMSGLLVIGIKPLGYPMAQTINLGAIGRNGLCREAMFDYECDRD